MSLSFIILIPVLLAIYPYVYNIIVYNSNFFEEGLATFGNILNIVFSFFDFFIKIGSVLPGRLYPIYSFMIGMILACFIFHLLHLAVQILGSIFSLSR